MPRLRPGSQSDREVILVRSCPPSPSPKKQERPGSIQPLRVDGALRRYSARLQLVLRSELEVRRVVGARGAGPRAGPLVLLTMRPRDHRITRSDLLVPAQEVRVRLYVEELGGVVEVAGGEHAVPRPDRHVGDGVGIARHVVGLGQPLVEDVKLALHLHGEAV